MAAALINAALPFKSTLLRGDRLCSLTSSLQFEGKRQLRRDVYVRMTHMETKQVTTVGTTPTRNCNMAAKAAATSKTDAHTMTELEMTKEYMTDQALESDLDVYCDILPDSMICPAASWIWEEAAGDGSEFVDVLAGSKKPQRLSSTSWDLLD